MAFQVDITEPALIDTEDYVRFIRDVKKQPEAAEWWFRGLVQAIHSLEEMPERCPLIPEQNEFAMEISFTIHIGSSFVSSERGGES